MHNKTIVFVVVGAMIGFILGFFVAQIAVVPSSSPQPVQAASATPPSQEMSEDHPSTQVMAMMQQLRRRAEESPQDVQVRLALGRAYLEMRLYNSAVEWLEQAESLDGRDPLILKELATAHYFSGRPEKSVEYFEKSLAITPDDPQALQNLGVVHNEMQNYAEAVKFWQRLVENYPDYPHIDSVKQHLARARERM